jgi:dihydropteroate synthase
VSDSKHISGQQPSSPAPSGPTSLRCGRFTLDLSKPVVMGILNVTPDSFSDGGRYSDVHAAVERALAMESAGAGIIDVGGESTRPGADEISEAEELKRVIPIIEALAPKLSVPISVDTSKPGVIAAAVRAGATIINDVRALREPGALEAAASTTAAVCLMHMQGTPRTMQLDPSYVDVVKEVAEFLRERMRACEAAGIGADRLVLDPGIGFGKRLEHNLALLAALPELRALGAPLLVGVSRKGMLGALTGRAVDERLPAGLAVAAASVLAGAAILRVHDVPETVDAVKVATALRDAGYKIN